MFLPQPVQCRFWWFDTVALSAPTVLLMLLLLPLLLLLLLLLVVPGAATLLQVRYAFDDMPSQFYGTQPAVYNAAGLPATPLQFAVNASAASVSGSGRDRTNA